MLTRSVMSESNPILRLNNVRFACKGCKGHLGFGRGYEILPTRAGNKAF